MYKHNNNNMSNNVCDNYLIPLKRKVLLSLIFFFYFTWNTFGDFLDCRKISDKGTVSKTPQPNYGLLCVSLRCFSKWNLHLFISARKLPTKIGIRFPFIQKSLFDTEQLFATGSGEFKTWSYLCTMYAFSNNGI